MALAHTYARGEADAQWHESTALISVNIAGTTSVYLEVAEAEQLAGDLVAAVAAARRSTGER